MCLENQEYGRRDSSCSPRGTLYPQKLARTSPTSGGRSVGIFRSRTQTTEIVCFCFCREIQVLNWRTRTSVAIPTIYRCDYIWWQDL
jgi:hypothetical protein